MTQDRMLRLPQVADSQALPRPSKDRRRGNSQGDYRRSRACGASSAGFVWFPSVARGVCYPGAIWWLVFL
jgi:hypothetical protein